MQAVWQPAGAIVAHPLCKAYDAIDKAPQRGDVRAEAQLSGNNDCSKPRRASREKAPAKQPLGQQPPNKADLPYGASSGIIRTIRTRPLE
jgi:hypothetical protein